MNIRPHPGSATLVVVEIDNAKRDINAIRERYAKGHREDAIRIAAALAGRLDTIQAWIRQELDGEIQ